MVWKRMTCKGRNWASAVRLFMHGTLCSGTVYCTSLLAWPHFLSPLIHSQQNSDFWLNLDVVKCRVFLLRQLWIVNYYVKSPSNNLSNEKINTLCFQRNDFSKIVHFGILIHVLSWRQQKHQCSVYAFVTEIIWLTFGVIIDDP